MAKPRIFISSTFYDLKQVRSDLDFFIEQLGYEPVRNEEGDIAYSKDEPLEEYCYKEIKNVDVLICIIGGRFGSESKRGKGKPSITQMELKVAINEGKQVYIFIDNNVLSEYETYLLNKEKDIDYRYVDNRKIYEFIEEIKALGANNVIKGFDTVSNITRFLKEQFAGLFQRFLEKQTRIKEVSLIKDLEKTAQTLNKLVNYLSDENKDQADEINKILMINHPLVEELRSTLEISYNFYFEGLDDVKSLIKARGFSFEADVPWEDENIKCYRWSKTSVSNTKTAELRIDKDIFDKEDKLKFIRKSDWDSKYVEYNEKEHKDDGVDLPF